MTDDDSRYIDGKITYAATKKFHDMRFEYIDTFKNNDTGIEIEHPIVKYIYLKHADKCKLMAHKKKFCLHHADFFYVKIKVTKEQYEIVEIY